MVQFNNPSGDLVQLLNTFVSGGIASEGALVRRKGMPLYESNFVTLVASALTLKAWLAVGDHISLITRNPISYISFSSFSSLGHFNEIELKKTKGAVEDMW